MPEISDADVRKLYAEADHYDEKHARVEWNGAEFDKWLIAHDNALLTDLANGVEKVIDSVSSLSGNHKWQIIQAVQTHITDRIGK